MSVRASRAEYVEQDLGSSEVGVILENEKEILEGLQQNDTTSISYTFRSLAATTLDEEKDSTANYIRSP